MSRFPVVARILPAESLSGHRRTFGFGTNVLNIAAAVSFPDGVSAASQCRRFLIVHGHASKSLTDMMSGASRIGIAVDALRIDVDQTHVNRGKRVVKGRRIIEIVVAIFTVSQPFVLKPQLTSFSGAQMSWRPKPKPNVGSPIDS